MKKLIAPAIALTLAISACDSGQPMATELDSTPPLAAAFDASQNIVDLANAGLEAQGSEYRVAYAEYITDPSSGQMGNIIVANDRGNKQLAFDFIPDDPRRGGVDGDPNTIDFLVDQTEGATASGLLEGETTAAIGRAIQTWDGVTCSALSANVLALPVDLGLVQFILGFGGGSIGSDIMHAGVLPPAFFDFLAPGGSGFILGVTFTLTFTTGDLDNDGNPDLAAREIYYNDAFPWADDGVSNFDFETVALHEMGHGLSQAHFGKIHIGQKNGKVHFSPRAVMNAVYSGVQREIGKTDNAGHCSNWANWPNN